MASKEPTILVVEDDQETLNVLARALASGGYEVIWARNGADTLRLLTRQEAPIAVMIVDVILPDVAARELAEEVNRKHPRADIIYISAYDTETVKSHGIDPETMPFLAKPFEPSDLLLAVEAALDGENRG
jgi:DNA-binding response OmpR family regulator